MVLPNSAPIFPTPDFLLSPQLYVVPGRQGLTVLSLRGHHNLASVSVDNGLTELLRSLFSSIRSRPLARRSSLSFGLKELVLIVGNQESKRMTASAPYIIEKEVSPVDLRGVVLYVQSTCGISSAHLPFASSNLFFNPLNMTLFTASACPFPWG